MAGEGHNPSQSGTGAFLLVPPCRTTETSGDLRHRQAAKGAVKGNWKGMVKGKSKRCEARARGAGSTRTATANFADPGGKARQ